MEKKKHQNKSDLGENFIAPDGGWGWFVCIAGGISNFCILPPLQFFGLIFRDKLLQIGLSSSQITTIINVQPAISSCTGLLNGPMFRRFSFRQIGLMGAAFISTGLFFSSMANSFAAYIMYFSILYGFGMGISISSTQLALNTYFKEKRCVGNSIIGTLAGLGQIFLPYVTTVMLVIYGVQGTVILYSGLALHIFACVLIYQPVQWHTKKNIKILNENSTELLEIKKELCEFCQLQYLTNFGQELHFVDDSEERNSGTGTSMLSQADDGWYGSNLSLYSIRKGPIIFTHLTSNDMESFSKKINILEKGNFKTLNTITINKINDSLYICADKENILLNDNNEQIIETRRNLEMEENIDLNAEAKNLKWYQKVAIFFDLDLLRDFTYVNLMLGGALATFTDLNFSILTPFILIDFGFSKEQVAFAMSVLGCSDVIVRFLIPFVTSRIKWKNITFFLIGIFGMVIGRLIVSLKPSYEILLVVFIFLGCCKGIRTIFIGLILPSYVPLNRLPAASGLALLTSGIFTLSCGPFVGLIKDLTSYSFTINFLNTISMITVISWTIEILYRKKLILKPNANDQDKN